MGPENDQDPVEVRVTIDPTSAKYPSNSHKQRDAETPKVEKVITGKVVMRKPTLGKRIKETFTGDDANTVGDYILFEVLIPSAKATIVDAGKEILERLFFGDFRNRPRVGGNMNSHTPYNTMHDRPNPVRRGQPQQDRRPPLSRQTRATHNFDDVVLPTRGEAELVLSSLEDLIEQFEFASVQDLYDLLGETAEYTDSKWGWSDLRGARALQVRGGYLLDLPPTEPID